MFKYPLTAALALAIFFTSPAVASADCIKKYLPDAQMVGSGEGRRFVFHAYDAELFAPRGVFHSGKPFALTLSYRMQFSGKAIAGEAASQMRRINAASADKIAGWRQEMLAIFPDVKPGMAITGIQLKNGGAVFCSAGKEIGQIEDPAFARAFFGIWLGDKTESPHLRAQLMGQP
jgi:hypothetical protein